ncbi:MAG: homocysteine S-methyltransferase family protein [Oscillospiraceae bacterium]|nr:homocysteine S-methyltransferase family protein [Oscillospiraceae bacterium]
MERKTVLLDGATGTNLWVMARQRGLSRAFVGLYNHTCPEMVRELAAQFVAAGSEIILANTFCVNRPTLTSYPGCRVRDMVSAGVALAKEVCGGAQAALSAAPLPKPPADREGRLEAAAIYDEQLGAGVDAGADLIFLETFWEPVLLNIAAERAAAYNLPLMCSMTFEKTGLTFGGVTPEEMVRLLEPYHPAAVGLNCSCGPVDSLPVLRQFHRVTDLPLIFKPNAGEHTPAEYAEAMRPALELAQYVGGCCGTTPEDIAALRKIIG